ncbi:SMAD/FHA domain-containing protein [Thozetella sp. PMI_491]|nr:SMAD/FHA domain-containing protein [Thozetella sp. PMI_491]
MAPDYSESDKDRKRRHRDGDDNDTPRRRDRSRSKERGDERDIHRRRRSRSPGVRRHRSRDRDRGSGREREGDEDRPRHRHRRRDSPDDHRSRRYRDRGRDRDQDEDAEDSHRDRRRRRRSPDEGASRRHQRESHADGDGGEGGGKGRSVVRQRGPLPSQDDSFAVSKGEEPEKPKEQPNFGNTGVLAAASNSVTQADGSSVTLKYHEPAEARKPPPKDQWKLFVFKGPDVVDTIDLSARSCWLVGREMAVVDLPAEHPSLSKQHAVIQFRYVDKRNEFGDKIGKVKPYLIDLESANGTKLNGDRVPESRYLELKSKDMIQFGSSTREYVVMLAPKD